MTRPLVPTNADCTHGCWSCHAMTTVPRPPCPAEELERMEARKTRRRKAQA